MTEDIKVPEIGENVVSGEVVSVAVEEGDMVEVDQGAVVAHRVLPCGRGQAREVLGADMTDLEVDMGRHHGSTERGRTDVRAVTDDVETALTRDVHSGHP